MRIAEETGQAGTVVALVGPLLLPEAAQLHGALLRALAGGLPVRLDLAGVDEIDLACLQLLLSASRTFRAEGRAFDIADSEDGVWAGAMAAAGLADSGATYG